MVVSLETCKVARLKGLKEVEVHLKVENCFREREEERT